ncbi:MAG: histidine kinase [Bacteroidota bacterium]
MQQSVLSRKAIIRGGLITLALGLVLYLLGLMFEEQENLGINVIILFCAWPLISFLSQRTSIYTILGLIALLVGSMALDLYLEIPDNPITLPLIILFWLGVAWLILPAFFRKYQWPILLSYAGVVLLFLFFRMSPNYFEELRGSFTYLILIPLPIFTLLWLYEQWRWLKTLQTEKAQAELTALKNQVNPHFFFNTLNNLYGLAVEKSDETPGMILKLSDLMRYTIYEAKADLVSLQDEVNYLQDYISLHQIRYRTEVAISFVSHLSHPHSIAPLLLIIPLENAFKHGVESLAEKAYIDLRITTTESSIICTIINNYEPKTERKKGIGLANLRKRLALLYPDRHRLTIQKTEKEYTFSLEIQLA